MKKICVICGLVLLAFWCSFSPVRAPAQQVVDKMVATVNAGR